MLTSNCLQTGAVYICCSTSCAVVHIDRLDIIIRHSETYFTWYIQKQSALVSSSFFCLLDSQQLVFWILQAQYRDNIKYEEVSLVLLQFSWAVQFLTWILSFDSIGVAVFANIFLHNWGRTSLWIHEETGSSPAVGRRGNRRAELWSLSATVLTSPPPYNHSLCHLVMLWLKLKSKTSFVFVAQFC